MSSASPLESDSALARPPRLAVNALGRVLRWLGFWAAVVLPVVLAVLFASGAVTVYPYATAVLFAANVVGLVLGRNYKR